MSAATFARAAFEPRGVRTPRFHPSPFGEQFTHPRGRWLSARDGRYMVPRNAWTDRNAAIARERTQ